MKSKPRLRHLNKVLGVFIVFLCGISGYLYIDRFSFPNTFLSRLDVSRKSQSSIERLLIRQMSDPIRIQVKNRVYQYTYKDMGILLNAGNTTRAIFESNEKSFPQNILSFFKSLSSQRMLLPVLLFTPEYYQFAENSIFDFSKKKDEVFLDPTNKTFVYKEQEERYKIDAVNFKKQLILHFGDTGILAPDLEKVSNDQKYLIENYNIRLEDTLGKTVYVVTQDTADSFQFSPQDLKNMVSVRYDSEKGLLQIDIDDSLFSTVASPYINAVARSSDRKIPLIRLKKDLGQLIRSRLQGERLDTITTHIEEVPNTDGTVAGQYIEVDISQQRMYLFQKGDVFNTYKISSGLYYPTPVGHFKILNKAENAFSDIYNVWMPYWMAFAYSSESNAYYGIHELPYWIADGGERIQRPREFIGSPHTGGCVALDIGASREVYDFASVGMPIVIFN